MLSLQSDASEEPSTQSTGSLKGTFDPSSATQTNPASSTQHSAATGESAESGQDGVQVTPFTEALAELLRLLEHKGDLQVSTTVWLCFRSKDI
jgi:hypothetical protein